MKYITIFHGFRNEKKKKKKKNVASNWVFYEFKRRGHPSKY